MVLAFYLLDLLSVFGLTVRVVNLMGCMGCGEPSKGHPLSTTRAIENCLFLFFCFFPVVMYADNYIAIFILSFVLIYSGIFTS